LSELTSVKHELKFLPSEEGKNSESFDGTLYARKEETSLLLHGKESNSLRVSLAASKGGFLSLIPRRGTLRSFPDVLPGPPRKIPVRGHYNHRLSLLLFTKKSSPDRLRELKLLEKKSSTQSSRGIHGKGTLEPLEGLRDAKNSPGGFLAALDVPLKYLEKKISRKETTVSAGLRREMLQFRLRDRKTEGELRLTASSGGRGKKRKLRCDKAGSPVCRVSLPGSGTKGEFKGREQMLPEKTNSRTTSKKGC